MLLVMLLLLSLAVATAAANAPPRPVFPGAFSVTWNLTEGEHDPLPTVSSGATELDDRGSGKQRDTMCGNFDIIMTHRGGAFLAPTPTLYCPCAVVSSLSMPIGSSS